MGVVCPFILISASHEPKHNENSKSDRKCFVWCKPGHFAKDCDHRVRTVNEVTKTTPVSTPVSVITELGHSSSPVYNKNTSVSQDYTLALTFDIHSCSHCMASNMKPVVDSGAAIHVCPSLYGFSPLRAFAKQLSLGIAVVETCCIILGVKLRVMCIEVSKFR